MEYIIAFKTTNRAIQAERCLLEQKIAVGVAPLPSQIKAGCGICLRIKPNEIEIAVRVLSDNSIEGIELYSRKKEEGKYFYSREEIK